MAAVSKSQSVEWIESAGGPLLFAPQSSLGDWYGADGSRVSSTQSDYARACSIEDEIAVIPVGTRSALVLGDEPDRTALIPVQARSEVLLVRWRWAASEESLLSRLLAEYVAEGLSFVSAGQLPTSAGEYVLFDSACGGAHLDRYLSVSLCAGGYLIATASFKPDRETFALVHRLRPLPKVV